MPTYTTIAWETLIEPRVGDSCKESVNSKPQSPKSEHVVVVDDEKKKSKTPNHIYISPALYTTPELPPVPDFPADSPYPSPYVVTRKRRGGGGGDASVRSVDGFEIQGEEKEGGEERDLGGGGGSGGGGVNVWDVEPCVGLGKEEVVGVGVGGDVVWDKEACVGLGQKQVIGDGGLGGDVVEDEFFDPRADSMSVASSVEGSECGKQVGYMSGFSSHGEFYDADEDFLSDGSVSSVYSYVPSLEAQLRATRLSLLDEIEKRKVAEEALGQMYRQWQCVSSALSVAGLTFPVPPTASDLQLEINSVEQFSQELVVTRFVAEAIARGEARAEAELAAQDIIDSKDQEISRLRDKQQYYEAVNHEMSQRNQEIVEVTRRQRKRKNSQMRWVWSCIGLSVTVGASLLAYSYLPQTSKDHSPVSSCDSPDGSCVSSQ